jgi:hypothetical protein
VRCTRGRARAARQRSCSRSRRTHVVAAGVLEARTRRTPRARSRVRAQSTEAMTSVRQRLLSSTLRVRHRHRSGRRA